MAERVHKTNAMRALENAGVGYAAHAYPVDPDDLSGVHVAAVAGLDPDCVFKTLVLAGGPGEHVVCCIPVAFEVDLKKAARAAGLKRLEMLPLRDLVPLTGYVRGGCSPLAMRKAFPTFIDETAQLWDAIYVSAGERGLQLRVSPDDLARVVPAAFADLVK